MKPFNNLVSPPFFAILYTSVENGGNAGLHSEAISTLISAATLRASFLGFTSDVDADNNSVKIAYWTTHQAMWDWIDATRDLLPYRIEIDNCLGLTGCLWPWLNRLDEADVELKIKAA